jgi:hypothetical protein
MQIKTITLLGGHGDPLFRATMKDEKPDDYYYDDDKEGRCASHLTSTNGHGDPLFQQVQEQDHKRTTTKILLHIEFLDDDGLENWAAGYRAEWYEQYGEQYVDPLTEDVKRALDDDDGMEKRALDDNGMEKWTAGYATTPEEQVLQQMNLSDDDEDAVKPANRAELYEQHGDPLMEDVVKRALDDDGMEKWAAGHAMTPEEQAFLQQMNLSDDDEDAVQPAIRTEFYEFYEQHVDPLTEDVKRALDDDDKEKWAAGYVMTPEEQALQQMDFYDEEDAVQPIWTEFYEQHVVDPLTEDVTMEAWTAGDDVMTPQEAFHHQVEGHHYIVESKRHGDPLWDAIIKDPAWDKLVHHVAGTIHDREGSKEKAD